MRSPRELPRVEVSGGVALKPENVHLLTEYVLNLSMSANEDNDITPLYETYRNDARLSEFEKDELLWVFMSLQLKPPTESGEP